MIRSILCFASAVALTTVVGCSSTNSGSGATSTAAVSAMSVSPDPFVVAKGSSQQMSAEATFADGTKQDVTKASGIAWKSSNTSVATVDSTGNVVGAGAGTATITATFEGKDGTAGCGVP